MGFATDGLKRNLQNLKMRKGKTLFKSGEARYGESATKAKVGPSRKASKLQLRAIRRKLAVMREQEGRLFWVRLGLATVVTVGIIYGLTLFWDVVG